MMKLMNSLTHSCIHSLASFAIFAFSGSAVFMIRATGAKLRMSASDPPSSLLDPEERRARSTGEEESWDIAGHLVAVAHLKLKTLRFKLDECPNGATCANTEI